MVKTEQRVPTSPNILFVSYFFGGGTLGARTHTILTTLGQTEDTLSIYRWLVMPYPL